ncbi:hypothetical protein GYMLUDRAFT_240440 [Collybiopsis luxurians FD-317 M1]|nr:hypothetical protein GYMLUDRAFT_240440 [Collybiopsis luxurians FD-317 M1]
MKLSLHNKSHPAEDYIIGRCTDEAAQLQHNWVLNHLPKLYWSFTEPFRDMNTQSSLEVKLGDQCEERALRGLIQEELYNLMELEAPLEFAQVFFDILQCHEWIYKYPRILHRDISQANIMFRRVGPENQIHGVLNDFDLATILDDPDHPSSTSEHRTGTRPYMAFEQQELSWQGPLLYRYDLESIFYVMLILACHYHKPRRPIKRADAPYRTWFTDSYDAVSGHKYKFLTHLHWNAPIQEFFKSFSVWLERIRSALCKGLNALGLKQIEVEEALLAEPNSSPKLIFDEGRFKETFEGRFSYDAVFTIMRRFDNVDLLIKNPEHL